MRIRSIKPEFWTSETLADLSEPALLLAIGLLNYADDEGYFNANERLIKAALYPLRELSMSIQGALNELSNSGFIQISEPVDGRQFGRIVNFKKHQKICRPSASKILVIEGVIKAFDDAHRGFNDDSLSNQRRLTPGSGIREQGSGSRELGVSAPAPAVSKSGKPKLDADSAAENNPPTAPPEMLELFGRWCRSHPACHQVEFMHWQLRTQAYSMEVIQQAVDEWCLNMPTFQGRMNNPPATFAKYLENVNVKKSAKKSGADDGDEWAKKIKDIAELT